MCFGATKERSHGSSVHCFDNLLVKPVFTPSGVIHTQVVTQVEGLDFPSLEQTTTAMGAMPTFAMPTVDPSVPGGGHRADIGRNQWVGAERAIQVCADRVGVRSHESVTGWRVGVVPQSGWRVLTRAVGMVQPSFGSPCSP